MGIRLGRARKGFSLALLTILLTTSHAQAAAYSILDLGTLGGTSSYGEAINASGQVAGYSYTAGDANYHAFRTTPNGTIDAASDLGTLGGGNSYAYGINDSGQAIGVAELNSKTGISVNAQAFRTAPNGPINSAADLGAFSGGTFSAAYGVNASGQTVGDAVVGNTSNILAFRTTGNGVITGNIGSLGGNCVGNAINSSGQTVGGANFNNGVGHAFRTTPNGTITSAVDLGTLGGLDSGANAINASGQVVGSSQLQPGNQNAISHAFRTTATGTINAASDLGSLGGSAGALGINDLGQTVGISYLSLDDQTGHAFFVDTTGPMIDLNTLIPADSGWVLVEATAINNSGQITGFGTIDGQTHAFELTPTPEPASVSLMALGAVGLLRRTRRR